MRLDRAIEQAIRYETRVRDRYLQAAAQTEAPEGKRALDTLAREEQGHLDYLNSRLGEWSRTGRVRAEPVPAVFIPYAELYRSLERLKKMRLEKKPGGPVATESELLELALQAERETFAFYQSMVDTLEEEGKALFAPFLDIERGHELIVQAELDHLRGLGYWFDLREFDLENG